MTEEFKAKQNELYGLIASELLNIIPDHWNSLQLTSSKEIHDEESYGFYITNPEGNKDILSVPEKIFTLYAQLEDLFKLEAKPWKQSNFIIMWSDEIDNWKYEADYNY